MRKATLKRLRFWRKLRRQHSYEWSLKRPPINQEGIFQIRGIR